MLDGCARRTSGKCESSALLERAAHQVVGDLLVLTAAFAQVSVAITLNNIGLVYSALGRYEEALRYYEEDLQITKAALGDKHVSA